METVFSEDGTPIAVERTGSGPALIFVVGAFNDHRTAAPLAHALRDRFTVILYDRRGRGGSGDGERYSVDREIEDLEALVRHAGGSAGVFGFSSGAILALRASARGCGIARLVLYDPPPTGGKAARIRGRLAELVATGCRGDAVELFQTEAVGIPADVVARLRQAPFRPSLEAMAHTLVYESAVLDAFPVGLTTAVRVPTLVVDGCLSPPVVRYAARDLAQALPNAEYLSVSGLGHDLVPEALAPVLERFFAE